LNSRLIYPVSQLVVHLTGLSIPPNKALVGDNAFAYTSGMYQDGVLRGRTEGEIIDPAEIGVLKTQEGVPLLTGRRGLRRRLEEMGLVEIGVGVSALRRHGLRGLEPDASVRLEAGDVVVLLGAATAVAAGEARLLQGQ
jgi:hypothetical protein